MFKSRNAKITPSSSDIDTEETVGTSSLETMRVMSLATLFKLYGGQRHPHLETYEKFKGSGELLLLRYVPHGATVIYISHEWVGSGHPDPRGDQMYHLLLLLERLQRGDVSRTDMDGLSWAHPDPNGEQLRVLCRVIERLKRGELDTEMDPMHTILYKHKFTTKAKDWESMLKRTYFWVDWFRCLNLVRRRLRILVRRRWMC